MAMQQLQYHSICLLTLTHEQNEILHSMLRHLGRNIGLLLNINSRQKY